MPGRVARLPLSGPRCKLHFIVAYLTTGDAKQDRDSQRQALARSLAPASTALSVLGGDFNYVAHAMDRLSLREAHWSGGAQTHEEQDFDALVARPFRFKELRQEEPTQRSGASTSRLDRIYLNYHMSAQLDHSIRCLALPWLHPLESSHRPLWFDFSPPASSPAPHRAIPD